MCEDEEDTDTVEFRLQAVVDQLTRYGGEPDPRVLSLAEELARLNDDIQNMRNLTAVLTRMRKVLDEIEQSPESA